MQRVIFNKKKVKKKWLLLQNCIISDCVIKDLKKIFSDYFVWILSFLPRYMSTVLFNVID